jgi:hypothetical protein
LTNQDFAVTQDIRDRAAVVDDVLALGEVALDEVAGAGEGDDCVAFACAEEMSVSKDRGEEGELDG